MMLFLHPLSSYTYSCGQLLLEEFFCLLSGGGIRHILGEYLLFGGRTFSYSRSNTDLDCSYWQLRINDTFCWNNVATDFENPFCIWYSPSPPDFVLWSIGCLAGKMAFLLRAFFSLSAHWRKPAARSFSKREKTLTKIQSMGRKFGLKREGYSSLNYKGWNKGRGGGYFYRHNHDILKKLFTWRLS